MAIKDITSAINPSSATGIDAVHYLEAQTTELDSIIADPHGFLTKNNLRTTPQSQVHTTVVRRPVGPTLLRPRTVVVIVAHFSNCDTLIVIFVA